MKTLDFIANLELNIEGNTDKINVMIENLGKLKDGATPKKHNDELGLSIYFEKIGVFKQRLEILTDKAFDLNFDYSFQICDEEGCIFPPDQPATVKVSGFNPALSSAVVAPVGKDPKEGAEENITVDPKPGETVIEQKVDQPEEKEKKKKIDQGLITIFFTGFLFGFVALLTPCVFPMIPMTVSFFTKRSPTRAKGIANALIYGLSIIVIYVALGLAVTAIMGPTGLNELSTNNLQALLKTYITSKLAANPVWSR
jgi:thiol:disulfide interchange protein DsbD